MRACGWLLISSLLPFANAFASQTRSVVFHGQASEILELDDILVSKGVWGPRVPSVPVHARVKLDFAPGPEGVVANETFVVTLDGQRLDVSVKTSGRLLIARKTPDIRFSKSDQGIEIDGAYSFRFDDLAPFARVMATGIDRLEVANGSLFFVASPEYFTRGFKLRLTVAKRKGLGGHRVIFDRMISGGDLARIETEDGEVLYSVPFSELGAPDFGEPPTEFTLYGSYDFESASVVNPGDLPDAGKMRATFTLRPAGSFFRRSP